MSSQDPLARVYLVEDSFGDVVLTKAIVKAENLHLSLFVFRDGVEVIEQLASCSLDEGPDLVLLDFNLPKVSGAEVLKHMKTGSWASTPVFVMSGSDADEDRRIMSELGAQSYLNKPLDLGQLADAVEPLSTLSLVQREDNWFLLRN